MGECLWTTVAEATTTTNTKTWYIKSKIITSKISFSCLYYRSLHHLPPPGLPPFIQIFTGFVANTGQFIIFRNLCWGLLDFIYSLGSSVEEAMMMITEYCNSNSFIHRVWVWAFECGGIYVCTLVLPTSLTASKTP